MGNKLSVVVDIVAVGIVLVQMPLVGTVIVGMIVAVVGIVVVGIVTGNAIVAGMFEVDIDYNFLYVERFAERLGSYFRLYSIGIWIADCWF